MSGDTLNRNKNFGAWTGRLKRAALIMVLATACIPWPSAVQAAAAQEDIRVVIFADLGSKYKATVPAVTLKSSGSLSVGQNSGGSFQAWMGLPDSTARFSVDSYRVKVLEGNEAAAIKAAQALQKTNDKPTVFIGSKNGGSVYQVYAGLYASEQSAQAAVQRISSATGAQAEVKGNKHWSTGSYGSEQEANLVRTTIAAAGFDAFTVIQSRGQYAVWVGEESNDSKLSALKTELESKQPRLTLSKVNTTQTGLILRQEAGVTTGSQVMPHYMLSGSNNSKIIVNGGNNGIQVVERSQRTYRGDMEIGISSGQLALVNEVPLEQYLYSVVGAEVYSSWPAEALKAQAVAARSYALAQGNRFQIGNVVDGTLSQAYNGKSSEHANVNEAVDATAGEVIKSGGKVVEAVFSSNAGGVTADASEVWNSGGEAFASVDSSGDTSAQKGAQEWYHVLLSNGKTGYIREDNAKELEGVTEAGLDKITVTAENTNVRPIPQIQSTVTPVAKAQPGEEMIVLEKVPQSGDYAWVRGPFTAAQIAKSLQGKITGTVPSSVNHLDVTKRGPSGRVLEIEADGTPLKVKYPDMYRSAMGGLPSTLFDIASTGSYTVLGADGATTHVSGTQGTQILSASGSSTSSGNGVVVMNEDRHARVIDKTQSFIFTGKGNGHGLGLSQWGANGLAEQGYDYKKILQHYYKNVDIVKD
ncbi:SpoIID/LytB domain-containing protein [Paenibacillus sp. EKM202P]|uniref:SpoIID/LytB domain-containing protein n=1 Tax=unclassified Paenibacillus TaxID=185978 RepID=UPI0013EB9338|nr:MULTISPECIES: SpoIID/LytB domain-containing protein [unclassified Paenibacillus]KAF6562214.1 SpoIID/LytB domain-containing protein [Paenibacillus sp. EKM202P]KAF6567169.1 SpoIID/LytB domain-containing protein [Paenibacillus sp. EKM207P]